MSTSTHDAVWDWLKSCPLINELYFNFTECEIGDTVFLPTDTMMQEYIDGSQQRRYAVELVRFLPCTFDPNDKGNVEMQEDVEAIAAWLRAQESAQSYPAFPDNCRVDEIKVLETDAGYAIAQDGSMAKYMLPFVIDYTYNPAA